MTEIDYFIKKDVKEIEKQDINKNFRKIYNMLSEYSHPNLMGLAIGGNASKDNITTFYSEPYMNDSHVLLCSSIKFSLDVYIELFKRISLLINEN